MPTAQPDAEPTTARALADAHLDAMIAQEPMLATALGLPEGIERLDDLSPAGIDAHAELARGTLARLDRIEAAGPAADDADRTCARLLRERLTAALALHEAGDPLRDVGTLASPVQAVRSTFLQMPRGSEQDWAHVAARLDAVPAALDGYRTTLRAGMDRDLLAGPGQVAAVVDQLRTWGADGGWFGAFVAAGPDRHRTALDAAAASAFEALAYSHRKEYVRWVSEAKREQTRADRIAKTVEMVRAGQTR